MSYQITRTGRTFSAKEAMDGIAAVTDDRALELEDYTGYVCDAITEIADYAVSIYTADQIAYCRENPDAVRDAITDGLALDDCEYFKAHPGHDFEDYEAHLGAVAEFSDVERAIYEDLADAMRYAALHEISNAFGDDLDRAAWDEVDASVDWDDNNACVEDVISEAVDAYRAAVEDDEDEEGQR